MSDNLSAAARSALMAGVRVRGTLPELQLRRALRLRGARGTSVRTAQLPGKPDLIFARSHLAVFVDGAFWHGHPRKFTPGKSGAFWDKKIAGNVTRDRRLRSKLRRAGWSVVRVWDFQVAADPDLAAARIMSHLERLRDRSGR